MRGRLNYILPEHLLEVARSILSRSHKKSLIHLERILKSAADRGSDESTWLLKKILPLPENLSWKWLARVMKNDDSDHGKYYYAIARYANNDEDGLNLLKTCADSEYTPAVGRYGLCLIHNDMSDEGFIYLEKAWKLKDILSLTVLARKIEIDHNEEAFNLFYYGAAHGSIECMKHLFKNFSAKLTLMESVIVHSHYVLLSGNIKHYLVTYDRLAMFFYGRELYGYDEFWVNGRHPHEQLLTYIDFYLLVTNNARRSALQLFLILKTLGIGRDVTKLISNIVYQSRKDDPNMWCTEKQVYFKKIAH